MRKINTIKKCLAAALVLTMTLSPVSGVTVYGADGTLSDKEAAKEAAENASFPHMDDIRGNITFPQDVTVRGNDKNIMLIWKSADTSIISDTDDGDKAAGIVNRPEHNTIVPLTVTAICGNETATAVHNVIVKAAPKNEEKTSYIFAHFTGTEGYKEAEQIYFATSQDGSKWKDMTADKNPVLTSDVGEKGVRDPYLIRSPEGDRFFLIATDLSIFYRGGWFRTNEQREGSTNLVVWESYDLVNWTEPRLINVAGKIEDAGCAWAPEAIYDADTGNYVIYWSTNSSDNELDNPMNLFYTTTRDFYTFTDPVRWIDRAHEVIDTTMIYDETSGYYYRASKDEQITIDRCKSIYGEWETIGTLSGIFGNNNYSSTFLEGPEFFEYCEDDWIKDSSGKYVKTWGLMCDQYQQGRGYLPFRTTNLGEMSTDCWSPASDVNFGALKKRHGTILPITDREYNRVMKQFGYEYSGEYELIENNEPAVTLAPTATPVPSGQENGQIQPTPVVQPSASPAPQVSQVPSGTSAGTTDSGNAKADDKATVKSVTKGKIIYSILNKNKKTALVSGVSSKNIKSAVILDKVTIDGVKYKVTAVKKNAFKNCKKLAKVTVKAKGITSVGKNAFKGTAKKLAFSFPASCKNRYKKIFKK